MIPLITGDLIPAKPNFIYNIFCTVVFEVQGFFQKREKRIGNELLNGTVESEWKLLF